MLDKQFKAILESRNIRLNEEQLAAVHYTHGPLLVLAGAGSGKSTVLTVKIVYLMSQGIQPHHILAVTFTKKAANEMKHKLLELGLPGKKIVCGTFHAIFLKWLRDYDLNPRIIDSDKFKAAILKRILRELGLADKFQADDLLSKISYWKNTLEFPESDTDEGKVYQVYEQYKREQQLMDFDDILLYTYNLIKKCPDVLAALQSQFQYLFIDEFQDISPIQYEIIRMVAQPQNNLCVVGDDYQAIYSFRGSNVQFILDFDKIYPDAKVVTLNTNYRSTDPIVSLGSRVIRHNTHQRHKPLTAHRGQGKPPSHHVTTTAAEEAYTLVNHIKNEVGSQNFNYKDFAILYRTNSANRELYDTLISNEIPFIPHSARQLFYEHEFLKPLLDHLRLATDPHNINALTGILPSLYLNVNNTMIFIKMMKELYPERTLVDYLLLLPDLKVFHQEKITRRVFLIKTLDKLSPSLAIRKLRDIGGYDKYLGIGGDPTPQKAMIQMTLEELEVSASPHNKVSDYIHFVDNAIRKFKQAEALRRTPDADAVSIMTIHAAKGLEFPVVFVTGLTEGLLPHKLSMEPELGTVQEAIEEECRLCYVAITRARDELYLYSPLLTSSNTGDVSRFIKGHFE